MFSFVKLVMISDDFVYTTDIEETWMSGGCDELVPKKMPSANFLVGAIRLGTFLGFL